MDQERAPLPSFLDNQLSCRKHKTQNIIFVCISHQECNFDHLLCLECFDNLPMPHSHHLVSLKRFKQLNQEYNKQKDNNNDDLQQTLQMLKDQFNKEIDIVQNMTESTLSNILRKQLSKEGNQKFRQSIKKAAQRGIWEKMHSHQSSTFQLSREINNQIKSYLSPVNNLITKINSIFDTLTYQKNIRDVEIGKLRQRKPPVQDSSRRLRERKVYNKKIQKLNPPKVNTKIQKATLTKSGQYFTEEQKKKIVNKIGKTMPKSKLAKMHRIAYSTLRKWELKYWKGDRGERKSSRILGNKCSNTEEIDESQNSEN